MNTFDEIRLELRLSWFQFILSVLLLGGFFTLYGFVLYLKLDRGIISETSPLVMLVVTYWFQRQRSRTAADAGTTNGNGDNNHPTAAPAK